MPRPPRPSVARRDDAVRGESSRPSFRTPPAVWWLTAAFALLCATWSVLTPPLLAPDETAHLSGVLRLTDGFEWPSPADTRMPEYLAELGTERSLPPDERSTLPERAEQFPGDSDRVDQMTQHPPLYYLIGSAVVNAVGADEWRWDRAVLLIRLLGAILAAPLVWLAWSTVARLTGSRKAGIVGASVVFLVPGLAQMLGVINNDTLAILIGSVVAWLSIRVLTGDRRGVTLAGLGVAFGLAGLAKGTLIAFGALVILALLFGRGRPESWTSRLWQTAWPLLVAFVFGQWWWVRNLLTYGTLQPYGFLVEEKPWAPGTAPNLGSFIEEMWRVTPTTFWGWFGRVSAPLPQILVDLLMVTCLLVVVVGMFRYRRDLRVVLIIAAPIVITLVLMLRVSWGAYVDSGGFRGMHGRYFYPVLIPIIALAALAALNLVREHGARRVFGVGAVVMSAIMPFVGLWTLFVYVYADGNVFAIRRGLGYWVSDVSPVPPVVSLALPVLFAITLAVGMTLAARSLLSRHDAGRATVAATP